jgi:predicted HAD superfamily Cof-like phosphohydrolase
MTIESIKTWFELAVPEPTDKNRAVQIGCHAEEFAEMLEAITPGSTLAAEVCHAANQLKAGPKTPEEVEYMRGVFARLDREEVLDSLADQIVTAVGVAHMFDLDISGALAEVNRSNFSKFVDGKPVFDANGKIAKPATYSKPDLTPFV